MSTVAGLACTGNARYQKEPAFRVRRHRPPYKTSTEDIPRMETVLGSARHVEAIASDIASTRLQIAKFFEDATRELQVALIVAE